MSSLNKRYFLSSLSVMIFISFFFLMASLFGLNFKSAGKIMETKPITEIPMIDIIKKSAPPSVPPPEPEPEIIEKVPEKTDVIPADPDPESILQPQPKPQPTPEPLPVETPLTEAIKELPSSSDTDIPLNNLLTESQNESVQNESDPKLDEVKKNYKSYVLKSIAAKKVYPMAARRKELTGRVKVHVVINADGMISLLELYTPCEYDLINDAALSAVKRAAPFKKMPSEMTSLDFIFTINFQIN